MFLLKKYPLFKLHIAFLIVWLAVGGSPLFQSDGLFVELLLISCYVPITFFVERVNFLALKVAYIIFFFGHIIGSFFFFQSQDIFTYSGFSAIKDFDFSISNYLKICFYPYLFWFFLSFLSLLYKLNFMRKKTGRKLSLFLPVEVGMKMKVKRSITADVIFFFTLILFIIINNWMFQNSFGITGISLETPILPYKLGGFIFYTVRYIVPLFLFFLLSRTKRSLFHYIALFIYAALYSLASVSRLAYLIIICLIFFYLIKDKRIFLAIVLLIITFFWLPFIELARNLVYNTQTGLNESSSDNLYVFLKKVILIGESIDGWSVFKGMFFRIGGTQDLVLAYQYDNSITGGWVNEFIRYFLNPNYIDIDTVQYELYAFRPPAGFSPGDGTLIAEILMISNKSILIIFFLSFLFAVLFTFHELIRLSVHLELFKLFFDISSFVLGFFVVLKFPFFWIIIILASNFFFFKIENKLK